MSDMPERIWVEEDAAIKVVDHDAASDMAVVANYGFSGAVEYIRADAASPLSAAAMKAAALFVLNKTLVASCTCGATSPKPDWHLERCRYRIFSEAAAMVEAIPDPTPDALLADALQVPEVKALVEAAQLMVRAYEGDFETIQGYYALQSVLDALGVKHD